MKKNIFKLMLNYYPVKSPHQWLHVAGKNKHLLTLLYAKIVLSTRIAAVTTDIHTHTTILQPFFLGLSGCASARRNLLDFMVQGKITEADTTTIWMGATPSGLISDLPPSSPLFMPDALPAAPYHIIPAWDRHQIYWLAYPVAWFNN